MISQQPNVQLLLKAHMDIKFPIILTFKYSNLYSLSETALVNKSKIYKREKLACLFEYDQLRR